jgi:hypothetical protein
MKKADLVLKSNAVFTGLTDQVFKGSVAICGNRIERVGMDDEIIPLIGPDTKVYEYDEELIMQDLTIPISIWVLGCLQQVNIFLTLLFQNQKWNVCP